MIETTITGRIEKIFIGYLHKSRHLWQRMVAFVRQNESLLTNKPDDFTDFDEEEFNFLHDLRLDSNRN